MAHLKDLIVNGVSRFIGKAYGVFVGTFNGNLTGTFEGFPLNTKTQGGAYGSIPRVGTDGVMEIGKYIDWHSTNGGTSDYTSRWTANDNGTVTVNTINGTLNGNASTATTASGSNSTFIVNPGNVSHYTEGIRVNRATNNWAHVTIGGAAGSTSGTSVNSWLVGSNPNGNFLLCPNGSSENVGLCLQKSSGNVLWNNQAMLHAGNCGNYVLPKAGGTMTGALNFANATWNLVGDDAYMGDHNVSGTVCFKGANGITGIALFDKNNENDYAQISFAGGDTINFNKKLRAYLEGDAERAFNIPTSDVGGNIWIA